MRDGLGRRHRPVGRRRLVRPAAGEPAGRGHRARDRRRLRDRDQPDAGGADHAALVDQEQAAAAPRYAPVDSLAGGTLAFTRDCWREVGGYPDASVGEDLGLLRRFADAGARIQGVSNRDAYVYIRHGRNSWRFDFTPDDGPAGWRRSDGFGPLTTEDLAFYASLDSAGTLEAADSAATPDTRPDADPEAVPTGSAADAD
ncbi:glycosyltransferase [Kitasatospora aburaviensis]